MKILLSSLLLLFCLGINAQEVIFADYFDIKTNSDKQTAVMGKIHLKRNKDVLSKAVPDSYHFEISNDPSGLFKLKNNRENIGQMKGLLVGELSLKKGKKTPKTPVDYTIAITLKNGKTSLVEKKITVHVVTTTMWEHLGDFYKKETIDNSRLWGRKKLSDKKIEALLDEIEANNGAMPSLSPIYTKSTEDIRKIEDEWEKVASRIGALGYAYANQQSAWYSSPQLYKGIVKASTTFMNGIPIFGNEIDDPIGNEIGDGLQSLGENGIVSHGFVTHQWRLVDGLGAPLVHIMPNLRHDIANREPEALALQEAIYRFYQAFYSITPKRRAMDNDAQRWRNISDTLYSEGAWSDANTAHRMRSLMVMGVIWNDYNRPITYVPYWYDDYYNATEFDGLSFAKGWSPKGIIKDIRFWCSRLSVPSQMYDQSGFHPDGTVSHHTGHSASDVAMVAYGFEWMKEINKAIKFFQHTPFPIENSQYQFLADRINYTYRRMVYQQQLDYVVAGRSHYSDMQKFVTKSLKKTINDLVKGKSPSTIIKNEKELIELNRNMQNNTHKHTESIGFWNADYLVHRQENDNNQFYYSVKQKSLRTSGAEDFSKVRKSWHAGSGVFQLKVDGDEYALPVLQAYDWHVLPGVTEEWRTDPMPRGRASSAGPGLNSYSGVLANGRYATSAFQYVPTPGGEHHKLPQYASASAFKSYHLSDNYGTAIGSNITRKDGGQGQSIVTCIDQSLQSDILYYSIDGAKAKAIKPGTDVDLAVQMSGPSWVFHKNKGYLVFPQKNQQLFIKTGAHINVTDTKVNSSKNYIIAIDHGTQPNKTSFNNYHYVMVANASLKEMPEILDHYQENYRTFKENAKLHGTYNSLNKRAQLAFFQAGKTYLDTSKKQWLEVNKPAIVMTEESAQYLELSVCDPLHSLNTESITIKASVPLKEGDYQYTIEGIESIQGETVNVKSDGNSSAITVALPDAKDGARYNYREAVLAGAPIIIKLNKAN
ncbi:MULTISPECIES: polysaccharide lyase family 8 super-sandwich domain-containing protein [unclassified Carboxylicivirga]|uniref:polysaccharide lyase family 8 super-sandwich domain-containing protein n=1 Tax=Carboxylicivirga TaxID=1628153 RepID=UPI003D350B62